MNKQADSPSNTKARKFSKRFRALALTVALAVGAGATVVMAQGGPFAGGHWNDTDRLEKRMSRMGDYLDLTTEQRTAIEAVLTSSRASSEPYRTELASLRGEMRALIETDEFYEDQVRVLLQSRGDAMLELGVIGARTLHAVRAELTPEQRAKADDMMQRFGKRKGGRHGFGKRGKQGKPTDD